MLQFKKTGKFFKKMHTAKCIDIGVEWRIHFLEGVFAMTGFTYGVP